MLVSRTCYPVISLQEKWLKKLLCKFNLSYVTLCLSYKLKYKTPLKCKNLNCNL